MRSSGVVEGSNEFLAGAARAAANCADCCARSSAKTSLAHEVDGGARAGAAANPSRPASALCWRRPAFWRSMLEGRRLASSWSALRPAPKAELVVVGATGATGATLDSGLKKFGVVTAIGLGRGRVFCSGSVGATDSAGTLVGAVVLARDAS